MFCLYMQYRLKLQSSPGGDMLCSPIRAVPQTDPNPQARSNLQRAEDELRAERMAGCVQGQYHVLVQMLYKGCGQSAARI